MQQESGRRGPRLQVTQGLICAHLALLVAADGKPHQSPAQSQEVGFGPLRNMALGRTFELHALETARHRVEDRYVDGAEILFPAMRRAWAEQVAFSERVAVMAVGLAESDGFALPSPDDPEAIEARVTQLVADLVEPSRSKAYDELGDGRRAASIAIRWLQPKLGTSS